MNNKIINNPLEANKMKIYAIICVLFMNIALIGMILTPTATSYEISIFTNYSIFIWIFLFLALALGLIIILNSSKRTWKIFGIVITLFVNSLFLLLPFLRNYFLYGRSDVITHVAYINEIILSNRLDLSNYYPISHIFVVNGHFLTTLNINTLMLLTPVIFFSLYFVGLYLFAKEITSNISETIIVLIFGSVLMYSYYAVMFLPTQLSFAIIPLFLFLLFRSKNDAKNRFSYSLLLVLVVFLMPFFHPLTSINLIVIFVILIVTTLIFSFRKDRKLPFNYNDFVNPLILLVVAFIAWISTKTFFNRNVKKTYEWLVNEVGTPTIDNYKDSLLSSTLGIKEVILKIFLSFGNEIIYILISIIASVFLIREMFQKKKLKFNTIFLILSLVSFTFLSGIFFLGAYGFSNPLREFVYVLFFTIIINGIFFSKIIYNSAGRKKSFIKYFLVIIILSCSVIGLYSSYSSVSTGETNNQVTYTEFVGMEWFFVNKNSQNRIYDVDKSTVRFSDVSNGIDYTKQKRWMFKLAPDHFNFTNETGYLILNEYVMKRYSNYWPDNPYYSKNDLNNIKTNELLNKIYDNSDTQIWTINKF